MTVDDYGRFAGEGLPRWLPLPLAIVGVIGAIVAAQGLAGAVDDGSGDAMATVAGSESTGDADTGPAPPDQPGEPGIESSTAADGDGDPAAGETAGVDADVASGGGADEEIGDCPPLFEVLFPVGDADVPAGLETVARDLASWMTDHPEAQLLIDGHADAAGSEQANLQLSFRRAEATAALMTGSGVPAERITPRGFGEYQPIVGESPDSERNRRVTMRLLGRDTCPIDDLTGDPNGS